MGQPRLSVLHSQAGWHAADPSSSARRAERHAGVLQRGGTCVVAANCLVWTKWQRQLRLEDLSQTRPPAPAAPADCYCPMQLTDQQRDIIRAFTVDL